MSNTVVVPDASVSFSNPCLSLAPLGSLTISCLFLRKEPSSYERGETSSRTSASAPRSGTQTESPGRSGDSSLAPRRESKSCFCRALFLSMTLRDLVSAWFPLVSCGRHSDSQYSSHQKLCRAIAQELYGRLIMPYMGRRISSVMLLLFLQPSLLPRLLEGSRGYWYGV